MDYNAIIKLVYDAKKIAISKKLKSQVALKGKADYVTAVDLGISAYIKAGLKKIAPNVAFVTEEEDEHVESGERFILDPIDGTTNLVHGYKQSSISLAYYKDNEVKFGVVFSPFTYELFFAIKGSGAHFYSTKYGITKLLKIGVENYMLTWTLGGYPSPTMDMIADFVDKKSEFSLAKWYEKFYGENAQSVMRAVESFCKGFKEYPFSIQSLYLSPKTLGVANLWDKGRSEKGSTMVCFAYDDFESWITPYPYSVYISQYEKLLCEWQKGIDILSEIPKNRLIDELLLFAKVAHCHFLADKLQTEYSMEKRGENSLAIKSILQKEKALCEQILSLANSSALVGFETSNHYFYTQRNIIEKYLNAERLEKLF